MKYEKNEGLEMNCFDWAIKCETVFMNSSPVSRSHAEVTIRSPTKTFYYFNFCHNLMKKKASQSKKLTKYKLQKKVKFIQSKQ